MLKYRNLALVATLPIVLLQGCGGGGGSSDTPTSTTPTDIVTWKFQDFSVPASSFANKCSIARTGIDPYTGKRYPDEAGSTLHEKMFLRAFSNDTYLWYDEIPDNNPSNYPSVLAYFNSLVTPYKTASGQNKDRFHFTRSYDDYMKSQQAGLVAGFGFNWKFVQSTEPREVIISYTEDNSPASSNGVTRGDKLLKINDIDVVNTSSRAEIDFINKTLFSPELGKDFTFTFETVDGAPKIVTLTSADVATSPVRNVKIIDNDGTKVGYMQYNAFEVTAQQPLINAFNQLSAANVDEIIMDLRYNGGGLVWQSAQVGYMLAGTHSTSTFAELIYNDKIMNSGEVENNVYHFVDTEIDWGKGILTDNALPTLSAKRVYVLTTDNTASSSELLINGLRGIDVEVVQIGTTTTGKPYGFSPQQNCGNMYYTIQFKSSNAKGFGDFSDGFTPTAKSLVSSNIGIDDKVEGCVVADDLTKPLGNSSEGMLSAALNYMTAGTCPPAPAVAKAPRLMPMLGDTPLNQQLDPLRQEAIHVKIN
ncbi:S41 family peptidase [Vibrio campbellii]|uniref:S41 family peptidase n=1 Tax=Vibrio campbellii TaxID=680 RepID=UPI001F07EF2F|nr:S41 family peptidase [Vibrio campbellii]UMM04415.1 S41 family peptidase [Vibrio campbellii]